MHKAHTLLKTAYTLPKLQLIDSVIIKWKCTSSRAVGASVHLFLRERFQNTIAEIKYIARTYIDILFSMGNKLVKFWVKSKVCLWLSLSTGIQRAALCKQHSSKGCSLSSKKQTAQQNYYFKLFKLA